MKKYFFPIVIVCFMQSCTSDSQNESKSGLNISARGARMGSSQVEKMMEEIGVRDIVSGKNFSDSVKTKFDAKIKQFIKNHKNEKVNAKRTAIDRATRMMLFDFGLLNSTKREDKSLNDFYVKEYIINGGPTPKHLFEALNYAKNEKLFEDETIKKITWYLEYSIDMNTKRYLKNIELQKKKIAENARFESLYKPNIEFMLEDLEDFKVISNKINNWPKINCSSEEDYLAIFN